MSYQQWVLFQMYKWNSDCKLRKSTFVHRTRHSFDIRYHSPGSVCVLGIKYDWNFVWVLSAMEFPLALFYGHGPTV